MCGDASKPRAKKSWQARLSAEADPARGLISNESPLGRALMGQKAGGKAIVNAPAGVLVFEIVGIQ